MFIGGVNHHSTKCTASKAIKEMQMFKKGRYYTCTILRQINKDDKMLCRNDYRKRACLNSVGGVQPPGSRLLGFFDDQNFGLF